MAKLTRYTSFEALKSDTLSTKLDPESAKAHADFEELMKLLRQEFVAQKMLKKHSYQA